MAISIVPCSDFLELRQHPVPTPKHIFFSKEWVEFIKESQNAQPVFLKLYNQKEYIGYFVGFIVKKFGFRILGSPFPGWTTMYLGCNLINKNDQGSVIAALLKYSFNELKCHHFEMVDREFSQSDYSNLDVGIFYQDSLEIDLTLSSEELYRNLSSKSCRYCIRKAKKNGIHTVIAEDGNLFVSEYYDQLKDVFKKQGLVPTYDSKRVSKLIQHLLPSGNLLLLRTLNSSGKCIATGIFPALNETMVFWGGASWRSEQKFCPNELMIWNAMQYWKEKNIARFDMGGGRGYKRKYGGYPISIPGIRVSKYPLLGHARNQAQKMFSNLQRIKGKFS